MRSIRVEQRSKKRLVNNNNERQKRMNTYSIFSDNELDEMIRFYGMMPTNRHARALMEEARLEKEFRAKLRRDCQQPRSAPCCEDHQEFGPRAHSKECLRSPREAIPQYGLDTMPEPTPEQIEQDWN